MKKLEIQFGESFVESVGLAGGVGVGDRVDEEVGDSVLGERWRICWTSSRFDVGS